MQNPQDVQLAASALRAFMPQNWDKSGAPVGLILGTGLSGMGSRLLGDGLAAPFSSLPGFPQAGVQSHAGAFVFGKIGKTPVLAQLGRCHLYEGHTPARVCMGCRVMGALGVKKLIVTNAAGALNPLFAAGSLMCMSDMINHTGCSPLAGPNHEAWGPRFPDMSEPFDPALRQLAQKCALELGIRLENGVYIGVHGPEMETPAETRMYRVLGADAVGMSTVLEVIAARHLGMAVLGISCLTNRNLPDCMAPAPLEYILEMAEKAGRNLEPLLLKVCACLGD